MKRTDSGFHESYLSSLPQNDPAPLQRSNTAPTRRRKPMKTPSGSISSSRPMVVEAQRPDSEHPSRPCHQRSGASSSRNSTDQSRGRHPSSSKACSRGTSRTGIDPSRPSRHYRIQSSHTAPVITSRDIDDPVALHFRSCSLFQNPSYHAHSGLPSPTLSQQSYAGRPSIASRFTDDMDVVEEYVAAPKHSEEAMLEAEGVNTPMQWTSPSTRQREYKRIDKANSGIRGFVKKVMPRCVSGPQERFYEKDQSDAGSVRRYRMDSVEKSEMEKQPSSLGKTSAAAMRKKKN